MIELFQFRPGFAVPNLSPFCLKLETWLKMTAIEYQVSYLDDPRKAPFGKLPYIKHDQRLIADSSCIIDYLTTEFDVSLDQYLSEQQLAIAHACQVMVEERLYWVLVYHRWLGEGWPAIKAKFFSSLPLVLRQLVPILVQKQIKRDLHGHGLARHSVEQINRFAEADLASLSAILGEQTFLMGDKPSSVDAVVFAMLCQLYQADIKTPLKRMVENYPNLYAYQLRIGQKFFPDYY